MRFCLDRELSLGNKNGPGPNVPDTQPWDSGEHEHDMFTRGRRSFDSSVTSTCDACLHSPNGMGTHLEQRTAQHLLRRPPTNRKIRQQTEFGFVKFCIDKVQGQAWSGGGFRIQFGGGRRPVKHEQIHSLEPYVQERGTDILSRSHRGVTLGLAAGGFVSKPPAPKHSWCVFHEKVQDLVKLPTGKLEGRRRESTRKFVVSHTAQALRRPAH